MMEPRILNREKINAVGKIGHPHTKEWNWTTILHYTQKNSKLIKDLNVRLETIKPLVEYKGSKLLTSIFAVYFTPVSLGKATNAKFN